MRFPALIAMFVGVLFLAGCGSSEPKTPPRWSPNPRPPPRDENYHGGQNALLLKYDANKDGSLTREELAAGLRAEFNAMDTNHKGCLDPEQVAAINAARIAADQSVATPLQDWNGDGCVDFREFSNTANSLFVELDRNGDGVITPQEFNPARRGQEGAPDSKPARQGEGRGQDSPGERRRPRGGGDPAPANSR